MFPAEHLRAACDCVKLALNCCSFLQSTSRLSLQRDHTYNPHPCTVLTAAHNIHTRPPDAPARLLYQRTLMNPYCPEDTSTDPAACGGSSSRGRPRRDDDSGRPWNRRDFIPPDDPGWACCTVKRHEDFPRHIFRLFLLLCIQFRWLLTRGALGRALVTDAEAAIDASLSEFSRPRTFLPTTCRTLLLFKLCSRMLHLTCLR